jgi:hypothetical protein
MHTLESLWYQMLFTVVGCYAFCSQKRGLNFSSGVGVTAKWRRFTLQ